MRAIPHELDEAALIDGCGVWDLFHRVIVPLSRNGIVTVSSLPRRVWNDYLTAWCCCPTSRTHPVDRAATPRTNTASITA